MLFNKLAPKSFITKIYNSTTTYLKDKKVLIKIASDYPQSDCVVDHQLVSGNMLLGLIVQLKK